MRLISRLNESVSRVFRKFLKYFNDTAILTSFVLPAAGDFPDILILNLDESNSKFANCYLDHLCNITRNFLMF